MRTFAAFLIVASATATALAFVASTGEPQPSATPRAAAQPARASSLLARPPQLGVACRVANSIRCDRVGFAVWLRRPAGSVRAAISGHRFALRYQEAPTRVRMYMGFLHPAGLADGALRVPFTAHGMWFGEGRVSARVRIWVEEKGRTTTTVTRVPLRAGWG